MHVLIAIALKSLLIAGLTLGLLALMKQRSAAERSWVAHIGLLALVLHGGRPARPSELECRGSGPARHGAPTRWKRPVQAAIPRADQRPSLPTDRQAVAG